MRNSLSTYLRPTTVAAAALALIVGCSSAEATKKEIEESPHSDAGIAAKIETKLAADPETNPFEIDVDVEGGVVRLSGAVETEKEKNEAEALARSVSGVVKVRNEIVLGDLSTGEVISDAWVVTKIKAKLTADPEINPFRIDVDAVRGVVTLSGKVPSKTVRDEAMHLAMDTRGVRKVENRLEIVPKKSS